MYVSDKLSNKSWNRRNHSWKKKVHMITPKNAKMHCQALWAPGTCRAVEAAAAMAALEAVLTCSEGEQMQPTATTSACAPSCVCRRLGHDWASAPAVATLVGRHGARPLAPARRRPSTGRRRQHRPRRRHHRLLLLHRRRRRRHRHRHRHRQRLLPALKQLGQLHDSPTPISTPRIHLSSTVATAVSGVSM